MVTLVKLKSTLLRITLTIKITAKSTIPFPMIDITILAKYSTLIGFVPMGHSNFLHASKSVPTIQPSLRDVFVKMVFALGTKMVISAQLKLLQSQI